MTKVKLAEYLSGGYVITRYIDGASHNQWLREVGGRTEDLLPPQILSVGLCNTSHAPVFDWTGPLDEDYANYGIPSNFIPELSAWASAKKSNKEIGFPNIFLRLSTAQEYLRRFAKNVSDLQLLGIGLHQERLHQIIELELRRPARIAETGAKTAGFADTGFAQAFSLKEPPIPSEIVGFDVICCEYNIDHSWICNGLQADALDKFHFRPNGFGLIDEKADADKLADYADEIQPEPGVWLPILVMRYPLSA
jgi:hypothetical protein